MHFSSKTSPHAMSKMVKTTLYGTKSWPINSTNKTAVKMTKTGWKADNLQSRESTESESEQCSIKQKSISDYSKNNQTVPFWHSCLALSISFLRNIWKSQIWDIMGIKISIIRSVCWPNPITNFFTFLSSCEIALETWKVYQISHLFYYFSFRDKYPHFTYWLLTHFANSKSN